MGSSFQGHILKIDNQDLIQPSLMSLYKNSKIARATHNVYAYRIRHGGLLLENARDDGEYGAAAHILKLLQEKEVENVLIVVTRWKGGPNMGPRRMDMIKEAAKQALMKIC